MTAEMGELVVGAYLKEVEGCDFVDYNVRPPGGGSLGQQEFDVLGLRFADSTAYLCEVATHIRGLNYGGKTLQDTLDVISKKHARQCDYASSCLNSFRNHHFMFWSPYVPVGILTQGLDQLTELELVINAEYANLVDALRAKAQLEKGNTGNAFFRSLQILESLRR